MNKNLKRSFAALSATVMLSATATVLPEGMPFDFGTGITASAEEEHHYDSNGFCTDSGCSDIYQPADKNSSNYYEIDNAGKLYWFAAQFNNNGQSLNAVLTADVVVNTGVMTAQTTGAREWIPIGNYDSKYTGTFDGQGHTISGLYLNNSSAASGAGFFGGINSGGNLKNVGIVNSYICGGDYVGGLCGIIYSSQYYETAVSNCYNEGIVVGKNKVGGVVGTVRAYSSMDNCYNTGSVTGGSYVGGICGYLDGPSNNSKINIDNSYNVGSVKTISSSKYIGGVCGYIMFGQINNSYFLKSNAINTNLENVGLNNSGAIKNTDSKTEEQFSSGEIAYLLNQSKSDNVTWYQDIGTNASPVLSGNKIVYYRNKSCVLEEKIYSNVETSHDLGEVKAKDATCTENGNTAYWHCTECNKYFSDKACENEITLDDTIISAKGHSLTATAEKAATCTENGNTAYWHCTECDKYFRDEACENEITLDDTIISAKGHSLTATAEKAPPCTENGNTAYWHCTECNKYFSDEACENEITLDDTIISAKGHSLTATAEKAPTCTENGNTAYWHCTECDKYFSDEECTQEISSESTIIPATGFEFDEETGVLTIVSDDATIAWGSSDINKETVKRVEIQNGVTSIGNYAFSGCSNLTAITIPDSVTSIGSSAFQDCSNLTEITIPPNVKIINNSAFQNCSNLTTVRIPESVEAIGRAAFQGCSNLKTIDLPNSVNYISTYAFQDCSALTEITIPEGVTSINNSTFAGCKNLISVNLPKSLTSIGNTVFYGCTSLTSIVIPNGVTSIGSSAFASCDKLNTMMYPDGLDVSGASIPETTTRIEYTMEEDRIIITNIILGVGKTKVELPQGVDGKEIVHEHTGGTASCNQKAICEICDTAYGEFTAHNLTEMEAVLPTCTENGNTAYWHCTECNKYFSDEACENEIILADTVLTANGHNYVDGKCTECGVFENGIGERLEGYSLSLDGNIGVNFYMELDENVITDENAYMQFTLPNGETPKVKVSEAVQQEVNGNTYYVFSCEVAAKEMFDKITAQIITSDKKGEVYEYSVEEYIQYIRENSSEFDEKTINLVNAMANYGDYARAYFNNEKVNASAEMDAVTADTLSDYEKQTKGELPEGITYYGSSLLLESNTVIRHYFKVADGTDVSAYGFDGNKDGYYYKDISGIFAGKFGIVQNVTVGNYTILYSPLSYAYAVLNSDFTDESLKNLVKALYLYEQSAEGV